MYSVMGSTLREYVGLRRTVIYGNRCLQLFELAPAQFMSPSLRADGKYYDADDEGEAKE